MVNVTINNKKISVSEDSTILEAAKIAGIKIPTLCYLKELNEIGACRICVVEVEGIEKLAPACVTTVKEGMVIRTNSPRVRAARKTNIELILSEHDCHCTSCARSGNCALQAYANDIIANEKVYEKNIEENEWDETFPLIKNTAKCIKCMRCIQFCDKVQTLGVWDILNSGARTTVGVSGGRTIREANCSLCGQCITHCPVGALYGRSDTDRAFDAIADEDKITIVQIAPAVRGAWGESLGLAREEATIEKMTAAIRAMGIDYVFDTDFSADLTIMEEGSEFIERFTHKDKYKFPMFTSCCPGWIRFIKTQYPDMLENLSTAKSPHQMFGAIMKTYFAEKLGVDPSRLFVISIMPCIAKKSECDIPVMQNENGVRDVDLVLTTRELDRMIKAENIDVFTLTDSEFDRPFEAASGAGVIFGATGGVMEAALRSAYFLITGTNADADAFSGVRGMDGWKEAEFEINGLKVRAAVASGLGNARRLIEAVRAGKVQYDFVEIMACPGGCSGGGGQPIAFNKELAEERAENLYFLDKSAPLRFSHENPDVKKLYENFLGEPLSHKSHELLHTEYTSWNV